MKPSTSRPNGRHVRDTHRTALVAHFAVMVCGLAVLALVNRALTPTTLWIQWAILGWGVVFVLHLAWFEKGTMATMGRPRR